MGECTLEGWRSSAWHFQRGWEKNKERWREKLSYTGLRVLHQLQKSEPFPSSFCWQQGHGATSLEKSCWASFVSRRFLLDPGFAQAHGRAELLGSCTACLVFTVLPSDPFTNKAFSKHVFKQCLSFCWSPGLGSWCVRVGTIPFWAVALQNCSGHRQSCSRTTAHLQAWVLCLELGLNEDS